MEFLFIILLPLLPLLPLIPTILLIIIIVVKSKKRRKNTECLLLPIWQALREVGFEVKTQFKRSSQILDETTGSTSTVGVRSGGTFVGSTYQQYKSAIYYQAAKIKGAGMVIYARLFDNPYMSEEWNFYYGKKNIARNHYLFFTTDSEKSEYDIREEYGAYHAVKEKITTAIEGIQIKKLPAKAKLVFKTKG